MLSLAVQRQWFPRTASKAVNWGFAHSPATQFYGLRFCSANFGQSLTGNIGKSKLISRGNTLALDGKRMLHTERKSQLTVAKLTRKTAGLAVKGIKLSYLALALIPTSMTVAAGYHYAVGHPHQVVRAHLFFAWTGFLCLPLSAMLLASYPFVVVLDYDKRSFLDWVQRTWAQLTCLPFFHPDFVGVEHIAPLLEDGQAVVYVSNHQSWSDIYSLFWLPYPIRFVSKTQIFFIPVVGWCMGLIGHVGVRRSNKDSRNSVIDTCVQKVKSGVSVFIFAEGTRSRDGYVQQFKRGAFVIAKKANAKIVPISISGTGILMPANRGETWMERGEDAPVVVRIHEAIDPLDFETVEELQEATRKTIEAGVIIA